MDFNNGFSLIKSIIHMSHNKQLIIFGKLLGYSILVRY